MVAPGDILAGKYRVERVLGRGGMGYVIAARHTQLDQPVAVKFLMPELCDSREAVARFLREARASVRIRSEHVARVLDVGTLDDGAPYMVMEFLEGHDLAHELALRRRLPTLEAVDYVLQACEAVAEAHAAGIVHRDLKPANLFLTRRADGSPLIKVLDFGISKAFLPQGDAALESSDLTATQGLIGSPHYMSPEQVRQPRTVDVRTDIWSLGVILHELMAGRPPFTSETPLSVLASVLSDPAPSLALNRPDAPVGLGEVVGRCLEKDPRRRFHNVAELAQALQPFAPAQAAPSIYRIVGVIRSSEPAGVRRADPAHAEDREVPTLLAAGSEPGAARTPVKDSTSGWGTSQAQAERARRRWLWSGAIVAAVLLLSVSYALLRGRRAALSSAEGSAAETTSSSTTPERGPGVLTPSPEPTGAARRILAGDAADAAAPSSQVAASDTSSASSESSGAPAETSRSDAGAARGAAPASNAARQVTSNRRVPSAHPSRARPSASTPTRPIDPLDGRR